MSVDRTAGVVQTYATDDLEQARAFMTAEFMGHVPRIRRPYDDFRLRVSTADRGGFVRHELRHRGTVQSASEPFGGFLVGHVRSGRARFLVGATDLRLAAGDLYLYPQGYGLTTTWIDADLDSVLLGSDALDEVLAEAGLRGRQVFDGTRPRSAALADQWQRTVHYVDGVSTGLDLAAYPLVAHQLARLLASVLLATFPHRRLDESRSPRVPTASVRRALDHIESHAHEPVGLVELARVAGVSPRALQQAFRSQLDTTPTEYARRVRLVRAYHDLDAADPTRGATVADVAARWGFGHRGRFAADFQSAFGRAPRAVLHN